MASPEVVSPPKSFPAERGSPKEVSAQTPTTRPCSAPPGGRGSSTTKFSALKPSQQVVVSAFLDPANPGYLNKLQAYKQAHPMAKDTTAGVEGCRTLENPRVQEVVRESLEARGWDKERILDELNWNVNECKTSRKLGDHREGVGLIAKVTGNLIEKREVKTLTDDARDEIRRVVSETQRNGNH